MHPTISEARINEQIYEFSAAADRSKKIVKLDNETISRISDLYQYLKVVYFSPVDINITAGPPTFRRSFIDQAVSQYSFDYITKLRNYNRILKQRNALLKTDFDKTEKRSWDEQFIDLAVKLIRQRQSYLAEFIPVLQEYYHKISDHKDKLSICYKYSFPNDEGDLKTALADHLIESLEQEIHFERSLCGPHLDDIELFINQHSVRNFGSQGQKRSLAIAIRLVQAKLISQLSNDAPVLMFDDVLSDLDSFRAAQIIDLLHDKHQIFIATPNKTMYDNFQLPKIVLEQSDENE